MTSSIAYPIPHEPKNPRQIENDQQSDFGIEDRMPVMIDSVDAGRARLEGLQNLRRSFVEHAEPAL